jgi:deoxyribodipyrimidine photo-lyase
MLVFEPTLAAMQARLMAVNPAEYARSRNSLEGAVTALSPYITHGMLNLPDVLHSVASRFMLDVQHKLVFELGWREYFQHVWGMHGDGIFESLHEGVLPDSAYATELPPDIAQASTGVPTIDMAVQTLHATGYLHNHARMWLASYVVHLRKVHWRVGADWLYGHLLDGDLASNHLSWQWVAATGSRKPYLFNAENVAKYAPQAWHAPGSVLDASYEVLDKMARSVPTQTALCPTLSCKQDKTLFVDSAQIQATTNLNALGRDVYLVHPWNLGPLPSDVTPETLVVGVFISEFHERWPWSAARWRFVYQRMQELTPIIWRGNTAALAHQLQSARSTRTVANAHVNSYLPVQVLGHHQTSLFCHVTTPCASFFQWWSRATKGVKQLSDLPGWHDPFLQL